MIGFGECITLHAPIKGPAGPISEVTVRIPDLAECDALPAGNPDHAWGNLARSVGLPIDVARNLCERDVDAIGAAFERAIDQWNRIQLMRAQ